MFDIPISAGHAVCIWAVAASTKRKGDSQRQQNTHRLSFFGFMGRNGLERPVECLPGFVHLKLLCSRQESLLGTEPPIVLRLLYLCFLSATRCTNCFRLHALGFLTEWRYKSVCIELGRRGYRSGEPDGIERETSAIWKKILAQLWSERTTKEDIAKQLKLPSDEIESLIWGLTGAVERPERADARKVLRAIELRQKKTAAHTAAHKAAAAGRHTRARA